MSQEVEFKTDERAEAALETLKLGGVSYTQDEVKRGPRGGEYVIREGKKVYLSDIRKKQKKADTPKRPTKVNLNKYESHPLAQSINGIMALICQGANRTILTGKKQFAEKDIKNIKMGEAWVYWVEQRAKVSSTQPELVVLSAFGGFFGRIAVLSMGGPSKSKKPKIVQNLEEGGLLKE